jgi:ribonuclease HI
MTQQITINTDGACIGNPGPGGFAAIISRDGQDGEITVSGGHPDTTNNRNLQ